jgi:phosphate transport system substrate-binding protein
MVPGEETGVPEQEVDDSTDHTTRGPCRRRSPVVGGLLAVGLLASACSSGTNAAAPPATTTTAAARCTSSAPGGVLSAACDTQAATAQLAGAGANSVSPFFTRAFFDYAKANSGVTVNYSPAGSSVGVTDIEQNTVQFGDSEVPIPAPANGTAGAILQLPVDLGGVALSYNLPGVSSGLKLDGPTLAGIFLGKITKWNDATIAALNPKVKLPDLAIVAVHRADSSGPGYDLDQYLIDAGGSAWTTAVGTKASTHWPVTNVGVGQQLNTGLATYVQQTAGAIGYVEYAYALQAKFTNVAVKNGSGAYVVPTTASIAAAASSAANLGPASFNIVNSPGATTYPLANLSWTLIYQKQPSTAAAVALGHLFDWLTTTEQKEAAALGYSPLPANAVHLAHETLLQLQTSSGAPVFTG